ncbi:hypothetical protein CEUSTIGMA_g5890.t1 [Chlamydomonas eustigma]|uniref:Uncharacterized protein n=1 Tax=Chlamydomonas eustigma TaxID=1157962 RepID=A0A250X6Q9_9CHLO|nr:hypothetical protein CEUSTIGMA_g5890.t1 [Chlamydomonas eustigma]|eukprot:GAX78450.1 hypothetical protein CEUSTIGMA_g5890.t1 [Chlamydomonas eustigma]
MNFRSICLIFRNPSSQRFTTDSGLPLTLCTLQSVLGGLQITRNTPQVESRWGFSAKANHIFGRTDRRKKRFTEKIEADASKTLSYDYEWVIVKGGQRMLARAPSGTKQWKIWSTYEDLQRNAFQERRKQMQGRNSTWLVDRSGALLK